VGAQAEDAKKFPSFQKFCDELGLALPEAHEDGAQRDTGGREGVSHPGNGTGQSRPAKLDPRTKEQIMEDAQKVADLDTRRLKKLNLLNTPDPDE